MKMTKKATAKKAYAFGEKMETKGMKAKETKMGMVAMKKMSPAAMKKMGKKK
jgi:hypothetical protein